MKDPKDLLFEAILSLETIDECSAFFEDLNTINEISAMIQRFQAAILLSENKTYDKVIEETKISSATLSRVSKCYRYGNGYRKIIDKMKKTTIL